MSATVSDTGSSGASDPGVAHAAPTLAPRFVVLAVLLASAALDGGAQHSASHWLVVAGYGLCTALIAFGSTPRRDWTAACLDGLFAGYLLAEHVFVTNDLTRSAAHTATLVPAFLLLLASGLALAPARTAAFAALVAVPWAGAVAVAWTIGMVPSATLSAHLFGLASFVAASGFVLHGTVRLRTAIRATLRSERERAFLSRFVPPGTGPTTGVRRRHACLLGIDIRGFSELSRRHAPDEVLSWLLQVRALVNAAIGEAGAAWTSTWATRSWRSSSRVSQLVRPGQRWVPCCSSEQGSQR